MRANDLNKCPIKKHNVNVNLHTINEAEETVKVL